MSSSRRRKRCRDALSMSDKRRYIPPGHWCSAGVGFTNYELCLLSAFVLFKYVRLDSEMYETSQAVMRLCMRTSRRCQFTPFIKLVHVYMPRALKRLLLPDSYAASIIPTSTAYGEYLRSSSILCILSPQYWIYISLVTFPK